MIAFYQRNPFSHMIWWRCLLHVSRVLSPTPPPHPLPPLPPQAAAPPALSGDYLPITIICSSSGLQEAEQHSWGGLWGITGDTAVPHPPTPRARRKPWSPLCWLLIGGDPGLHLEVSLTVSFTNPPEKLPGSISCPPTVADDDWKPRMFRRHFCLLFAAEATWCMRLILCRQAATNLLG